MDRQQKMQKLIDMDNFVQKNCNASIVECWKVFYSPYNIEKVADNEELFSDVLTAYFIILRIVEKIKNT